MAAVMILVLLLAVFSVSDISDRRVPNSWLLSAAVLALAAGSFSLGFPFAVAGALTCGGLALALWLIGALGGGDVKLLAVCGLLLGPKDSLLLLVLSVFLAGAGGAVTLISVVVKRRSSAEIKKLESAFVPYIFAAALMILISKL